jgi:hypothetical protein
MGSNVLRKGRLRNKAMVLGASAAMLLGLAGPIMASADSTTAGTATTDVNVQINGGPLTLGGTNNTTYSSGKLTGKTNVTGATADAGKLSLTDARGTGAGYSLTAQATPLKDGSGHVLTGGNLTFAGITVAKVDSTSGTIPASQVTKPTAVDNGNINVLNQPTDLKNGDGMGSYQVNLNELKFNGSLPASGYANQYHTTVTYTLSNGPESNQ